MVKEPWLAVNFSMFLPGLGQFYGAKWPKGLFWFLTIAGLVTGSFWSLGSAEGNMITGLILAIAAALLYIVNIFDAHQVIYRQRNDKKLEKIPRTHKNPWFAVFASRIIPGLGHIYSNRAKLGLFLLVISLFGLQLKHFFPIISSLYPIFTAVVAYDVFRGFPQPLRISSRPAWIIIVSLAISLWGILLNYFPIWVSQQIEAFVIPSDSMKPTLQIGDRILVHKTANYLPQDVGDIVVFRVFAAIESFSDQTGVKTPEDTIYIKRVIGIPGAKIAVDQGQVYLNGQPLQENYLQEAPNYKLSPLTVPQESYFVLGDNRNNSLDSHIWGFLPKQYIVGHAYKIFWPIGRQKSLLTQGEN